MDRGISPRKSSRECASDPPVYYLVGTPKGRLTKWSEPSFPRPGKRCAGRTGEVASQEDELYVFAESRDRIHKGSHGRDWPCLARRGCSAPCVGGSSRRWSSV